MRIVFATRNPDKVNELRHALAGLPVEILSVADFPDIAEVPENGATLLENALIKARAIYSATGETTLADDTGLEVDALGGAPGVHSARFAGPRARYAENLEKLLQLMKDVPEEMRWARFRTVIAIVFATNDEQTAEGECEGRILTSRRGSGGFGYDPVFFVPATGKTFAEMSLEEKDRVSHRGRAMRAARKILAARLEECAPRESRDRGR